ncbi:FUSC family protein [Streptomyces sp. enrichment culture]|uniref:FUSC family protein n=1 Tax=Streptomyces sp. enrichment culture TaxID=1795815 RepID=UPI003F555181
MSWFRALKETSRSGLSVERTRLEPLVALRGAVGLGITIGLSLWALGAEAAVSSAFGAFQAAIATFQRSWRPRPELALASGASLAVSTFLGYLTVTHLALFLALLAVWTFAAGLSWAAGPTTGLIASSNVAMMLITVTLPTSVAQAGVHAATMVAGGLIQAALIVLFPVRRWGAHRDALADALAAEADYARRLRHDPVAPFDPSALMEARAAAALTPRQARRRPAELRGTRGLAERIRPVLASLADPAVGVPPEGPERDRARELLGAAAAVLDAAAHAVRHGTSVDLPPAAVAAFRTPDTGSILTGAPYRAATRLGRLLQDVVETAQGSGEAAPAAHLHRPSLLALAPVALRAMRDELHRSSPVARHALRVTVVACAGYLLGTALPFGHGYWAPLAAVMVMRPDFSQTYSRAVARFAGTLVGVAVATGVLQITGADPGASGALAVGSAALMYLLMRTGQFAAQACIGAYVVFLLGMGGEQWTQTVPERVLLTLLGGVLAMVAYAVYPAWETPRLRTYLADWLAAQGRYAAAVVRHHAEPAGRSAPDVREALLGARAARAAWHAAVARAAGEPVRHRGLSRVAADDAEDALTQTGRVAMLMEAHLPERGAPPLPPAGRLADALRTATEAGARAVRERRVPDWTAVRDALQDPGWADADDTVVRQGGRLLLRHLTELSEALDTAVPPMTAGRDANGRITKGDANGPITGEDANGRIAKGNADGTATGGNTNGTATGGNADGPRNPGDSAAR